MPFPDDADDEIGFVPPLPPEDRLWRHPSEHRAARPAEAPPLPRRGHTRLLLAIGVVLVAVAGISAMALMRHDARRFTAADEWFTVDDVPPGVIEQIGSSIVRVTAERPGGTVVTTGVMLRDDGHLVTAADPIADATAITVRVADGSVYNATIVGTDLADDIAVLDIPSGRSVAIRSASMAAADSPSTGDRAYVIGRAGDSERPWVATTTIDAVHQRVVASDGSALLDMLRTSLPALPDVLDSFSGVVCGSDGTVLGLMTARGRRSVSASTSTSALLDGRTVGYATPISWIERVSNEIIDAGSFHRAWIGIAAEDASNGALVHSVAEQGPAARAGILPGDVLTAIGGSTVESADRLAVIVRSLRPGDRIAVQRIRSDSVTSVDVVVSEQA